MTVVDLHPRPARSAGRVPPHDLDAERSLLGAMLLSRDAIGAAVEHTTADDFYRPAHAHIYQAITELYAGVEPVDAVTVADRLRTNGTLDSIGGAPELQAIQTATPSTTSAGRYARIVAGHALLRRLGGAAGEIGELVHTPTDNPDRTLDQAETLIYQLGHRRRADTTTSLADALSVTLDRIETLYEQGGTITGVPTGYIDLDEQLAGLQPANLIIVGARPGAGKTSLALGAALHAAKAGHPVLFFSLEMSTVELTMRLIATQARIDFTRLRNGTLSDADWPRLSAAVGALGDLPLHIDDNANVTLMEIRAKARRHASRDGLGLIVVDYLQLMTGADRRENRQVEVADISRGLKLVARDLDVPVVACSQLSRNLENRADKRPSLADLRESGALEQDSDIVIFVYRDELYNAESADRGTAEIIIAKYRNGPTGTVRLAFIAPYATFANMARI